MFYLSIPNEYTAVCFQRNLTNLLRCWQPEQHCPQVPFLHLIQPQKYLPHENYHSAVRYVLKISVCLQCHNQFDEKRSISYNVVELPLTGHLDFIATVFVNIH